MNWKETIFKRQLKSLKKGDYVWVRSKLGSVMKLSENKINYLYRGAIEDDKGIRLVVLRTNSDGVELVLWSKVSSSGDFFKMADVYRIGK